MAGAGIKAIKTRITSVESTKKITKAMELVSSSKLRKAKTRAENAESYFVALYKTIRNIAKNTTGLKNVYMTQRPVKNKCYVVIAGDRGLAGGYNTNVFKTALNHMAGEKETILPIGKKSYEFFSKRGYKLAGKVENVESCSYDDISELTNSLIKQYKAGEIDEVQLVYTKFISPLVQKVQRVKLLPLSIDEEDQIDVKEEKEEPKTRAVVQYLPSPEKVLEYVIPSYVKGIIYGGLIESFASEQGARRTAMESATDNADEMLSQLELSYNRARQSAVTSELIDIVGGVEALK
ncbi:MAG: ATP synthase F1 subunit gamma [Clostridioides sp.]|nr:ATP synthase F1 subunit gamma [Clostridioides sp.]